MLDVRVRRKTPFTRRDAWSVRSPIAAKPE
jgi:hypothetical protein